MSILSSDSSNLESFRSRPRDLQEVLNRLNQLRAFAETTSKNVNRQEEQVVESQGHVHTIQRYLQQLHPWIEQAETYLQKRLEQTGASSLADAKQLVDRHKVNRDLICLEFICSFVGISRRMSSNVNNNVQSSTRRRTKDC